MIKAPVIMFTWNINLTLIMYAVIQMVYWYLAMTGSSLKQQINNRNIINLFDLIE